MADPKEDPKNVPMTPPAPPPVVKSTPPVPPVPDKGETPAMPAKLSIRDLREKVADHLNRLLKSDSSKERAHIALAVLDLFNE